MADSQPRPFKIDIDQETLDWITQRVQTTRVIPDATKLPEDKPWDDGVPSVVIKELVDYWKTTYDWRKVEAKLNSTFQMYTLDVQIMDEVICVHFAHNPSERPGAIPLLFAHGWPGNFTEVNGLLSLTSPEDSNQQAFHIIAPSIPGFVFSSSPQNPGFDIAHIGEAYHKIMLTLGYTKYMVQGGDWGSIITRYIAQNYPESCMAIHVNMLFALPPSPYKNPLALLWLVTRWMTPEEKKRMGRMQWWSTKESGYYHIQSTKPQTISYALSDSPVGMLSWIRDKLELWVEPDYVWDKEMVITWAMLYLLSNSAWHARLYKQSVYIEEKVLKRNIPANVAFGTSCFPHEIGYVPRWWAQASIADNIVFWKEHEKGGHFPSVECPEVLQSDIQEFVSLLPESTKQSLRRKINMY